MREDVEGRHFSDVLVQRCQEVACGNCAHAALDEAVAHKQRMTTSTAAGVGGSDNAGDGGQYHLHERLCYLRDWRWPQALTRWSEGAARGLVCGRRRGWKT